MTNLMETVIMVFALLFTLITHEAAHGYVAYLNGDRTAKDMGRLSFNPLKHLDLVGTLCLIVFKFGWAKPVPIDERNFKNRRLGLFLVSIAGVVINFLTAFISIAILVKFNDSLGNFAYLFNLLALYGLIFMVFNLIPIPPLDGSKVLASFLPYKFEYFIYKYERYSYLFLLVFIMINRKTGFIFNIVEKIYIFLVKIWI